MMKFLPNNFNDLLAILIMVGVFPALWILQGRDIVNIPEGVIGASIAIETLIAQFYFRKTPTVPGDTTSTTTSTATTTTPPTNTITN